jgi:hypothetical protein
VTDPDSGMCAPTAIEAPAVAVSDKLAPLTLTASLVAAGKRIAGAELSFFILTEKAGQGGGGRIGEAVTGQDGTARFDRRGGLDGLTFSDDQVTGYQVEFNPKSDIGGVQYCMSDARASLTAQ